MSYRIEKKSDGEIVAEIALERMVARGILLRGHSGKYHYQDYSVHQPIVGQNFEELAFMEDGKLEDKLVELASERVMTLVFKGIAETLLELEGLGIEVDTSVEFMIRDRIEVDYGVNTMVALVRHREKRLNKQVWSRQRDRLKVAEEIVSIIQETIVDRGGLVSFQEWTDGVAENEEQQRIIDNLTMHVNHITESLEQEYVDDNGLVQTY